jgi:hypothetical protein
MQTGERSVRLELIKADKGALNSLCALAVAYLKHTFQNAPTVYARPSHM